MAARQRGKVMQNPHNVSTINAYRKFNTPQVVIPENREATHILEERLSKNPDQSLAIPAPENTFALTQKPDSSLRNLENTAGQNITRTVKDILIPKPIVHDYTALYIGAGILGYALYSKIK